jgi:hypothetical protein
MPTNPGTVDEKPVLLAVLFLDVVADGAGDVAIAGAGDVAIAGDLGAFFASLSATALADFFLAVDSVGLAIIQKSPCVE